jgi:hypothetical protein
VCLYFDSLGAGDATGAAAVDDGGAAAAVDGTGAASLTLSRTRRFGASVVTYVFALLGIVTSDP